MGDAKTKCRTTGEDALAQARADRSTRMLHDAESAIADILRDGERPSFYNVAKRSCVARSTLYRRPELKSLVEKARERQGAPSQYARRSYADLVKENEHLRQEIKRIVDERRTPTSVICPKPENPPASIFVYATTKLACAS